ncbi:hypothetical protein TNCV_2003101 [Trichonephila clavipes]|nr:hypothetical protein TNCV_2003101 [Trichonephila clavipes]
MARNLSLQTIHVSACYTTIFGVRVQRGSGERFLNFSLMNRHTGPTISIIIERVGMDSTHLHPLPSSHCRYNEPTRAISDILEPATLP